MYEADFIMRVVERLSAYLASIVFLRRSGNAEQAEAEIAEAVKQTTGQSIETVLETAQDESPDRNYALFRLFYEQFEILQDAGDPAAVKFASAAYRRFLVVPSPGVDDRERGDRLAEALTAAGRIS